MKTSQYIGRSFVNAILAFIYIAAIAWGMFNAQYIFPKDIVEQVGFLVPLCMLLLFVISASITGALVLGKPIHLYLSGLKKEAFVLFGATVGWLVVFLLILILNLLK